MNWTSFYFNFVEFCFFFFCPLTNERRAFVGYFFSATDELYVRFFPGYFLLFPVRFPLPHSTGSVKVTVFFDAAFLLQITSQSFSCILDSGSCKLSCSDKMLNMTSDDERLNYMPGKYDCASWTFPKSSEDVECRGRSELGGTSFSVALFTAAGRWLRSIGASRISLDGSNSSRVGAARARASRFENVLRVARSGLRTWADPMNCLHFYIFLQFWGMFGSWWVRENGFFHWFWILVRENLKVGYGTGVFNGELRKSKFKTVTRTRELLFEITFSYLFVHCMLCTCFEISRDNSDDYHHLKFFKICICISRTYCQFGSETLKNLESEKHGV